MKLYLPRLTYGICAGTYDPYQQCFDRLRAALPQAGISYALPEPLGGESLVTRGRNRIAHAFLASDCDAMLLIDADIVFTPQDVLRLLDSGYEFVGCPYPAKMLNAPYPLIGTCREPLESDGKGFWRARDVGTGFLLLRRSVFERLSSVAPTYENDLIGGAKETVHAFFDTGIDPDSRQYLSEDWWLSRAFAAMGGELWLDGAAKLGHVGHYCYRAPSLDEVIAGPAACDESVERLREIASRAEDIEEPYRSYVLGKAGA
jgi:hypothetical protein